MKKFSISLFALLAIIFAVGSAFGPTIQKKFTNPHRIFAVTTSQDPDNWPLTTSTEQEALADYVMFNETELQQSASLQTLDSYYAQFGPEGTQVIECATNTDKICLVRVEDADSNPVAKEIKTGEFSN